VAARAPWQWRVTPDPAALERFDALFGSAAPN